MNEELTVAEKCEAIVRQIVEIANMSECVMFEQDWGGNSLTVVLPDAHTHVGVPEGDFETLVDQLYNTLHGGHGLSWSPAPA